MFTKEELKMRVLDEQLSRYVQLDLEFANPQGLINLVKELNHEFSGRGFTFTVNEVRARLQTPRTNQVDQQVEELVCC